VNAGSMRRLSLPFVESPPTLLAANRLVRAHRLSRVARTVREHDDGFALEDHWSIRLFG
jgi:hypothetical protein